MLEFIKDLFYSIRVILLTTIGVIGSFAIILCVAFYVILEYEPYRIPEDSKYISRLQALASDTLPSCKVIRKKHKDGSYDIAVYHLSEDDFKKVLKGIQSDPDFKLDPNLDFFDLTEKMLQKEHIEVKSLNFKYDGYWSIGFQSPNIIVYQNELYD